MRFSIFIFSLLIISISQEVSAQQADSNFKGDWYTSDGSNVLVLSLQNDYVLYDSEFWDYEISSEGSLQLKNQSRAKVLALSLVDGAMLLTVDDKTERLRPERNPDISKRKLTNVNLKKNFFNRDQVVLHGVVNPIDTMPLMASVIYNDAFQEEQQKYSGEVDTEGRFKIIFPLNNAQDLYFRVGEAFFSFYARPGGRMAMKIEESSFGEVSDHWVEVDEISFMGDFAELNEEFRVLHPEYMKIRKYEESDSLQKTLAPINFMAYRLNLREEQRIFYNSYFKKYPTSKVMQDLSMRKIRVKAAEDLMRYIWLHNYGSGRIVPVDVPDEYLRQVVVLMSNDVRDFTVGNYGSLAREFIMTMMPREEDVLHEKRLAVTYDFLSNTSLSEKSKRVLSNWKEEEAKREKHFSYLSFKGDMKPISDQFKEELKDLNNKINWDHMMSKAKEFSTVQRSSMVGIFLSQNYHSRGKEIPEYIVDKLKDVDLLPLVAENISETIKDFNIIKHKTFVEGVEIAPSADNLLSTLKEKYKGKVVYIDVWATWCAPCITQFSYLKELKANKLKDVVYVYVCAQSEKKVFDLMVKKHELVGENYFLDNDQYAVFDKEVNITGFPTYMVITKEGKLVREGIKRPSTRAELANQLKEFAASPVKN